MCATWSLITSMARRSWNISECSSKTEPPDTGNRKRGSVMKPETSLADEAVIGCHLELPSVRAEQRGLMSQLQGTRTTAARLIIGRIALLDALTRHTKDTSFC
jgi:hypothetical protein